MTTYIQFGGQPTDYKGTEKILFFFPSGSSQNKFRVSLFLSLFFFFEKENKVPGWLADIFLSAGLIRLSEFQIYFSWEWGWGWEIDCIRVNWWNLSPGCWHCDYQSHLLRMYEDTRHFKGLVWSEPAFFLLLHFQRRGKKIEASWQTHSQCHSLSWFMFFCWSHQTCRLLECSGTHVSLWHLYFCILCPSAAPDVHRCSGAIWWVGLLKSTKNLLSEINPEHENRRL